MPVNFTEAVGAMFKRCPWLVVDSFLLTVDLAMIVAYKDFDDSMKALARGMFVMCLVYFWLTALHILVSVRSINKRKPMPGYVSYSLFALKLCLLIAFAEWARHRGIV